MQEVVPCNPGCGAWSAAAVSVKKINVSTILVVIVIRGLGSRVKKVVILIKISSCILMVWGAWRIYLKAVKGLGSGV